MALSFSEYTKQFFWDFKRMDNANYNFEIIALLYEAKKRSNGDTRFNKPIITLIMAIIECILYDFLIRIKTYHWDSFPNIKDDEVSYFRGTKETDELRALIPQIEEMNLLRAIPGENIYADLEQLRIIRNRIHIQNRHNTLNADEYKVFTDSALRKAERCLEKVCEVLCNVYPRWKKQPLPMSEFPRPWS